MSLLAAALFHAGLGFPVFPCIPGSKKPLTGHGFQDASTDPEVIRKWWTDTPDANIGMPTQGLLVVDVDGAQNPWLERDPDLAMSLARGPVSLTPRGGRHYIYRQPAGRDWRNTAGKLAAKVDTRGNGGYILLPPSIVDGRPYRFLPGCELDEVLAHLPEPPGWLIESLEVNGNARMPATSVGMAANPIPPGVRNDTLARLAGSLRRIGMGASEIAGALERTNAERCQPPLPDQEVLRIVTSVCRYEPDQISVALAEDWAAQDRTPLEEIPNAEELMTSNPSMHPPVIHGLLREGEIMNIIAPPKMGKSWLVTALGLAVCTGRPWLDLFEVAKGDVLIVDNELHAATSANRIPRVAEALGIPTEEYGKHLFVANLRGQLKDLSSMRPFFDRIEPGRFKTIILDAFYRFLPPKTDENDNGSITGLYNQLDYHAKRLRCAFILIHHSSKGMQGGKDVTDVGAGAGAQARATDTHLILRRHKEDGVVVLESAIRSWPRQEPLALRFDFPVWHIVRDVDVNALEGRTRAKDEGGAEEPEWTPQGFVEAFVGNEPRPRAAILGAANERGLSDYKAGGFLRKAEAAGLAFRWDMDRGSSGYATRPPPEEADGDTEPSKRQAVEDLLRAESDLPAAEVARRCGVDGSYVRRIRREKGVHDDAE